MYHGTQEDDFWEKKYIKEKKKKTWVTSIFSFTHNAVYVFKTKISSIKSYLIFLLEKPSHWINLRFCKLHLLTKFIKKH